MHLIIISQRPHLHLHFNRMQVAKRTPEMMGPELKRPKLEGTREEVVYGFGASTGTVTNRTFIAEKEEKMFENSADLVDGDGVKEKVRKLAAENAVVVVGGRGCCMCHVVKQLLLGLGANPLVYEVQDEVAGVNRGDSWPAQLPVLFIGGEMAGGMEWLIAAHISGELVPLLKKAGALWL